MARIPRQWLGPIFGLRPASRCDDLYRGEKAFIHSKEKALQESLSQMRAAIHQYTKDKHKPPQTLDDLVIAGYLKAIPINPFTNRADTWQPLPVQEDMLTPIDENVPGITDVTNGANLTSS